jgi:hypothetical protein
MVNPGNGCLLAAIVGTMIGASPAPSWSLLKNPYNRFRRVESRRDLKPRSSMCAWCRGRPLRRAVLPAVSKSTVA